MNLRSILPPLVCLFSVTAGAAHAQLQEPRLETWGYWQRNTNGSTAWKLQPRLFVPFRFDDGWVFTQRVDVPLVDTDAVGPGNPDGGYSGGVGDIFIEEIFESPAATKNPTLLSSLRLVFPTGNPAPFGASQYQVAPGLGVTLRAPDLMRGVTFVPFARYFWGFNPQAAGVTTIRSLTLFPTATFTLGEQWSMALYPENPISYNFRTRTWFVPLDVLFIKHLGPSTSLSLGGALNVGPDDHAAYRYLINVRLNCSF